MKRRPISIGVIIVAFVLLFWFLWAFLLLSPNSFLLDILGAKSKERFSTFGPFGDAFGPVASLMATLAASGAIYAFINDRHDRSLQNFESNFFVLLSNLESITRQSNSTFSGKDENMDFNANYDRLTAVITGVILKEYDGRTALRVIVYRIREGIGVHGYKNIKVVSKKYNDIFEMNVNNLGHYFRTIHHIFRLIDERCPGDKFYYARIIRAQISNEELCLIAYNCIVGEGRVKFRFLAEKYSLFHNIHRYQDDEYAAAELQFFRRKMPDQAFRFEQYNDITFDD